MTVMPDAGVVRAIVLRTFAELNPPEVLHDVDETILIDDGRLVGRTYRAEGLMAMWLISVGILQFYDADGAMLRTVNLLEELAPQRMAA
jgi:hypothetical protein